MPRSKRDRRVTLAKAGKHVLTRDVKSRIVDEIRGAVDRYGNAYVLEIENSRNELLNNARSVFKDSKFYFGRNQICKVALGVDTSSEYADGISEIGKHLSGQTCLLFTDRDFEKVKSDLQSCETTTFARSGFVSSEEVVIEKGKLEEFKVSQEAHLRELGLPVSIVRGDVVLLADYKVCSEGETLTPEKAKLLEHRGIEMAVFKLTPICCWKKDEGFELLR
mmetsp:Transcript_18892/g.75889  ORF Transcript_18892/g.75889 Transcript_18892/m.75889 type:complete len:221 (-) Transcript_18892:174-836(-)|eukprot:CAMPEP_0113966464 /NCGR_PEP_ID=MMETSP0011_2-20120614/8342_1 /TAXON_ID=101924 /ORGANISM="Rhodosorus marinus" /LENGTH=220 /DNA_ID=CAMNT_0000979145 /DNA_START=176 /DNA_END=838 /DNA_ORIENTATION=- /assembly_acc=CAM_ASM_000156